MRRLRGTIAVVALAAMAVGCQRAEEHEDDTARAPARLAPLIAFEESERRAQHDRTDVLGPDPFRIVRVAEDRYVGLLRRASALTLVDGKLRELARVPGPTGATGLALGSDGVIVSSGELSSKLSFHKVNERALESLGFVDLPELKGVRAVARGPGSRVYVLDTARDRVLELELELLPKPRLDKKREIAVCRGAFDVTFADELLRVPCLFDHALQLFQLDAGGKVVHASKIVHDGPIWSSDAVKRGQDWLVILGGVEDHPLDRSIGSFGYVDSFAFLYRWRPGSAPARVAAIDVSEHGVITPKLVDIRKSDPLEVDVVGYGGESRAVLTFDHDLSRHSVRSFPFAPGSAYGERLPTGEMVIANPLLDAWVLVHTDEKSEHGDVGPRPSDALARLGETLFFTELMAKNPKADGPLSRFTCETCHFEGGVDGRTHHTGRGNVRATTKPLFGLLENRPYFSRALDPTMAAMVDNEFRVANKGGGADPWFSLDIASHVFLRRLGVEGEQVAPLELRRALIHFLAGFRHRPNPAAIGRTKLDAEEAKGAAVFRDRCESCHSARRFSDEPATRVDFSAWEALVFEGRLVWASAEYEKTGIEPYVHERGTRVPSLRRLERKRPYFTNGSALTLADVLERVRFWGKQTWHEAKRAPKDASQLDAEERASLRSFLQLL